MTGKGKAVCLFSGGLDSTTCVYYARSQGYEVFALTIDYGQIHAKEIDSAKAISAGLGIHHELLKISLPWKGSALIDGNVAIPVKRTDKEISRGIPVTYVPARNTLFLSYAASYAETLAAEVIFIGANAIDYSGYPDCRPEYLEAFEKAINLGTKAGVSGRVIRIESPLVELGKGEIVLMGSSLGVPYEKTWSCYHGQEIPCAECDSCILRAKGFREAKLKDPLLRHAISSHA